MQDRTATTPRPDTRGVLCHPPPLPATNPWHRRADQALAFVYRLGTAGFVAIVLAGFLVANLLPDAVGIWLVGFWYLAIGGYCSLNFWRCREAHCIITGIGLTVLGLAVLAAAAGVQTVVFEYEEPILLAVLVTAVAFEAAWRLRHGSNAVRRG